MNRAGRPIHPAETVDKICDLRIEHAWGALRIARAVGLREKQVAGVLWRNGFYGSANDDQDLSAAQGTSGANNLAGGGR